MSQLALGPCPNNPGLPIIPLSNIPRRPKEIRHCNNHRRPTNLKNGRQLIRTLQIPLKPLQLLQRNQQFRSKRVRLLLLGWLNTENRFHATPQRRDENLKSQSFHFGVMILILVASSRRCVSKGFIQRSKQLTIRFKSGTPPIFPGFFTL